MVPFLSRWIWLSATRAHKKNNILEGRLLRRHWDLQGKVSHRLKMETANSDNSHSSAALENAVFNVWVPAEDSHYPNIQYFYINNWSHAGLYVNGVAPSDEITEKIHPTLKPFRALFWVYSLQLGSVLLSLALIVLFQTTSFQWNKYHKKFSECSVNIVCVSQYWTYIHQDNERTRSARPPEGWAMPL